MKHTLSLFFGALLSLFAQHAVAQTYETLVAGLSAERASAAEYSAAERRQTVERGFDVLTTLWLGTRWGLGLPQTDEPGDGKVNCGTFAGTILEHLGFRVDVRKLQRQPAELIINTFVDDAAIVRFRNASMERFLRDVRSGGDGIYIIGLDFHVGFLRVVGDEVRFIHASYETHTVVDEDTAAAGPIITSKYRVVGKVFDDQMLKSWAAQRRFRVIGNW